MSESTTMAAGLLRIWLDADQPCRAWCMAEGIGLPKCYGEDGELVGECWFLAQARLAAHTEEEKCPACEGLGFQSGAHTEQIEDCPPCDGTGRKKTEASG